MPKFILELSLGNDGVNSNKDLVKTLRSVAKSIDARMTPGYKMRFDIRDINGR